MDSFLAAAALRSCAAASGPLPTDDALAALELHGSNICVASTQGSTLWTALLRARGLVSCVELGPLSPVERYNDHLLLLVEPRCDEVLEQFMDAGGSLVALVGGESDVPQALSVGFSRQLTVELREHLLSVWQRVDPAALHGMLDVRLELVDMEAPEWASQQVNPASASVPSGTVKAPFEPTIGSRTIRPPPSAEFDWENF